MLTRRTATETPVVRIPRPTDVQLRFLRSKAKRKVLRGGRRGGKTVGEGILAVEEFLKGRRILYATPTTEQVERFWATITRALEEPIDAGIFKKNESSHEIELPGTEQRIKAKTAWNADMLRGDFADTLILDELQLMDETVWTEVGAPMMLDTNGDTIFSFTPPSLMSRSISKARDKKFASKLFKRAEADTTGRWEAFHFTSADNPHISADAIREIAGDMTDLAYRQEILAEDIDEVPGALWTYETIEENRVKEAPPLIRIGIGVDPAITSKKSSAETGILIAGLAEDGKIYILEDRSCRDRPHGWASQVVTGFHKWEADKVIGETNQGGEMVEHTINSVEELPFEAVHASRGKMARAEPVASRSEKGMMKFCGSFPELEDQLCSFVPGEESPDRLDAMVWVCYWLWRLGDKKKDMRVLTYESNFDIDNF